MIVFNHYLSCALAAMATYLYSQTGRGLSEVTDSGRDVQREGQAGQELVLGVLGGGLRLMYLHPTLSDLGQVGGAQLREDRRGSEERREDGEELVRSEGLDPGNQGQERGGDGQLVGVAVAGESRKGIRMRQNTKTN